MLWNVVKPAAPGAMLWNVVKCCESVAKPDFANISQHFTTFITEPLVFTTFHNIHNNTLLCSFPEHPGIASELPWSLRTSVKRLHTWNRGRSVPPMGVLAPVLWKCRIFTTFSQHLRFHNKVNSTSNWPFLGNKNMGACRIVWSFRKKIRRKS